MIPPVAVVVLILVGATFASLFNAALSFRDEQDRYLSWLRLNFAFLVAMLTLMVIRITYDL